MKKVFLLAALAVSMAATAQTKKKVPPPPPPPPPVEAVNDNPPTPPAPPEAPLPPPPPALPKEYTDFLNRNPSVKGIHWKAGTVVIKKKNGEAEKYALTDEGIREAEAKYGKLPQAPPPPKPPLAPKPEKEWQ